MYVWLPVCEWSMQSGTIKDDDYELPADCARTSGKKNEERNMIHLKASRFILLYLKMPARKKKNKHKRKTKWWRRWEKQWKLKYIVAVVRVCICKCMWGFCNLQSTLWYSCRTKKTDGRPRKAKSAEAFRNNGVPLHRILLILCLCVRWKQQQHTQERIAWMCSKNGITHIVKWWCEK